MIHFVDLIRRL